MLSQGTSAVVQDDAHYQRCDDLQEEERGPLAREVREGLKGEEPGGTHSAAYCLFAHHDGRGCSAFAQLLLVLS